MSEQQPIPLPPATEADYRTGAAACLSAMTEAGRKTARDFLNTPTNLKKIKWYSQNQPNRPDDPPKK